MPCLHPAAAGKLGKRAVVLVARRRGTTNSGGVPVTHLHPAVSSGYTAAILDDSAFTKRPWEKDLIKSW